jgi:nondiscriminating glutamyl-tRNA synthetase
MLKLEHVPAMLAVFRDKVAQAREIDEETAKGLMKAVQTETGIKGKNLFMPVRAAISGQLHGPDMNDMMIVIGRDNLMARVDHVLKTYC